jgi:molecular chaperone DnaJ
MVFTKPCAHCGGSGEQLRVACRTCGGRGVGSRVERVTVTVPAGATAGMQIRVPGAGHAGSQQGPAGDLYVRVDVEPHALFRREGDDVHLLVPVAVHERSARGSRFPSTGPRGCARARPHQATGSASTIGAPPSPRTGGETWWQSANRVAGVIDERSKELPANSGGSTTTMRTWRCDGDEAIGKGAS